MTLDKINAIIAETQGVHKWFCPICRCEVDSNHVTNGETHDPRFGGCGSYVEHSPDYPNDWNALHAVVDGMTPEQLLRFVVLINEISLRRPGNSCWFRATKLDWCEAIIRTLAPERWEG